MGRPAKSKEENTKIENENIEQNEEVVVVENTTNKTSENSEKTDYEKMKEELDSLKKLMSLLVGNSAESKKSSVVKEDEISFISLYDGTLNLTTERYGGGTLYQFSSFGEEQLLPVSEAKLVIRNHKSMAERGFFYIANEELVNASGLKNAYKKILPKETIETLFDKSKDVFIKIFSSTTDAQKEIISDMLLRKIINKENVDMNIVDAVEKITGRDLSSEAENAKRVFKEEE